MPTHKRDVERYEKSGRNALYTLCGKTVIQNGKRVMKRAIPQGKPITCYSCWLEAKERGIEIRSPFNA